MVIHFSHCVFGILESNSIRKDLIEKSSQNAYHMLIFGGANCKNTLQVTLYKINCGSPDLDRTIETQRHVLYYWETPIKFLKPLLYHGCDMHSLPGRDSWQLI